MKQVKDFIDISRNLFNTNENIALHEPCFIGNEKKYLNESIDSSYVSSSGKYLDLIDKNISNKLGFKKCIPIVNGTSALYISLRSIGVKAGDEVITQALTFVATGNAIKHNNANPIFLDVDIDTMGLSYNSLKNFLENNCYVENQICYNKLSKKKIAACVPMHTFGFLCDIQNIVDICNKYHIPVVEDSAEAFGSFYNNKSAGSFGKLGVFFI
jgi:perosamine synthetase